MEPLVLHLPISYAQNYWIDFSSRSICFVHRQNDVIYINTMGSSYRSWLKTELPISLIIAVWTRGITYVYYLVLSRPGHPNKLVYFLTPCRSRYISAVFFCEKRRKIPYFNLPTSLENILWIYKYLNWR